MTHQLHTAAAEDHEAIARLHRVAAAMDLQGKAAACGDAAVRAAALADAAGRASAFAGDKSMLKFGADPYHTSNEATVQRFTTVARQLDAPRESLGMIVRDGGPRRRSRSWVVIA